MIDAFVGKFTPKKLEGVKKIGREYCLIPEKVSSMMGKISITPEFAGIFLGEVRRKEFRPGLALLERLAGMSGKKIFVDDKACWLFLCGRDLMANSITRADADKGLVLVQNGNDENLGLGRIIGNVKEKTTRIVVKNILDRGDFLRRER